MPASFPTSVKSFGTAVDAVTDVLAADINDVRLEIAAIETQLLTVGTWVPTFTGFSVDPASGNYRYHKVGKVFTIFVAMPNNGTSNATGLTITLPFTAATITGMAWYGFGYVYDNGALLADPGRNVIASAGTVVNCYTTSGGAGWTASGNKRCGFSITYETA